MKALAWYTAIFNILLIILYLLTSFGVVARPPFSAFEGILWAIFTLPVVFLAFQIIKRE